MLRPERASDGLLAAGGHEALDCTVELYARLSPSSHDARAVSYSQLNVFSVREGQNWWAGGTPWGCESRDTSNLVGLLTQYSESRISTLAFFYFPDNILESC